MIKVTMKKLPGSTRKLQLENAYVKDCEDKAPAEYAVQQE
jgi:hypothetical protein